ncbi:Csu type fimbrial protein [Arsenophonus nasoniae]|uniref:Spore coat U domain-containing protein n=1 Tax=Arsenophonus nasoniae TaxID=638 RepID=A0AA95GEI1_9GAMM|nr:spore coat U domain-containing protein [Arsenophonus nasoniae]WGL95394.1 spore coat U domain-containing protein [Arsenophonus nasoniae]
MSGSNYLWLLFENNLAYFILLLVIFNVPPSTAITSQSFQVSATITPGCLVSGGTLFGNLDFGTHPSTTNGNINASLTPNTSLTLACTPGTVLSMSINGGNNYTTIRNVKQSGFSTLLSYLLYADNAHTIPIGLNQNISVSYSNSNNIIIPIYGVLQMNGANNRAGTYTDLLTVTLSW